MPAYLAQGRAREVTTALLHDLLQITLTHRTTHTHSPPLLSRLDWHPHGALLAVPTDDGVVLLARDTWEVSGKLQGEHKKVQ